MFESARQLDREPCLVPNRAQLELRSGRVLEGLAPGGVGTAPAILTLSEWVEQLVVRISLLQGRAAPSAVDASFLKHLWHSAIARSMPGAGDAELQMMAGLAHTADRLIDQWDLQPDSGYGGRFREFLGWRREVQGVLSDLHCHTTTQFLRRLTTLLEGHDALGTLLPQRITLAGFIELTQLEDQLFRELAKSGVEIVRDEPARVRASDPSRQSFTSLEEEISAAARWAGARWRAGARQIAVIVNGLPDLAARVRTLFENHLQAHEVFTLDSLQDAPFRMHGAEPLVHHPLVEDALLLLDIALGGRRARHGFPSVSRFLLSPNWAGARGEAFARASLERHLRRSGFFRWSMAQIAERAASGGKYGCLEILSCCLGRMTAAESSRHPAQQLLDWLDGWGWPGEHPCRGSALDVQRRFLGLLERLGRQPVTDAADGLRRLKQMCGETAAPAPGGAFSPIQVLSPEDAYGMSFEAAWIANLTMENWPGKSLHNPLLPAGMMAAVPRADPAGVLAYTVRLTQALKCCAEEVRFSWCDRVVELPVSPSPLIRDLPVARSPEQPACAVWQELAPRAAELDGFRDHPWLESAESTDGKPLAPDPDGTLPQAVSFLNMQSACPLAAYLVHRLDATMEKAPEPFANELLRGGLVHAALEQLYRPLQGGTRRPDPGGIEAAVAGALGNRRFRSLLMPVEREALATVLGKLLGAWLDFEDGWPGGIIDQLEWRRSLPFRDSVFEVRVDRSERLADGRIILFDYKTGAARRSPRWGEERPGDLQLPLYSVLLAANEGPRPAGAVLARVRLDEMSLVGLVDQDGAAPVGASGSGKLSGRLVQRLGGWEGALDHWHAVLGRLLDEIHGGDCRAQVYDVRALTFAGLDVLMRLEEGRHWQREVTLHGSG